MSEMRTARRFLPEFTPELSAVPEDVPLYQFEPHHPLSSSSYNSFSRYQPESSSDMMKTVDHRYDGVHHPPSRKPFDQWDDDGSDIETDCDEFEEDYRSSLLRSDDFSVGSYLKPIYLAKGGQHWTDLEGRSARCSSQLDYPEDNHSIDSETIYEEPSPFRAIRRLLWRLRKRCPYCGDKLEPPECGEDLWQSSKPKNGEHAPHNILTKLRRSIPWKLE